MISLRRSSPFFLNLLLSLSRDVLLSVPDDNSWSASDTQQFLQSAKVSGVSKVGFLRHGKTGPTPENGADFDRQLTEEGREQATAAGQAFGKSLLPFHSTLLASPAPRTMDTAKLFLDSSGGLENIRIEPVQWLYDGAMQPEGSALFRKLGYAPLDDYVNSADKDDRESSRKVLGSYAYSAMRSILETLLAAERESAEGENTGGKILWVVGHAIYLPSVALQVALLANCDESSTDLILSTSTREAEGFLVDLEEASVKSLS